MTLGLVPLPLLAEKNVAGLGSWMGVAKVFNLAQWEPLAQVPQFTIKVLKRGTVEPIFERSFLYEGCDLLFFLVMAGDAEG